jgi:hypothetical protein
MIKLIETIASIGRRGARSAQCLDRQGLESHQVHGGIKMLVYVLGYFHIAFES